jgi:hypothetical protein
MRVTTELQKDDQKGDQNKDFLTCNVQTSKGTVMVKLDCQRDLIEKYLGD